MKRLESIILLGLLASFSGTFVFVVYTTRMRDGTARDRGHPLPPQLTSAAKRALSAARRKAMADSLLLTGAEQPVSPDAAEHPGFPKECGAEDSGGAACTGWAATGECEKNAGWMHKGCVHACGLCGGAPAPQAAALPVQVESDCADQSSFCGQWAAVGECDSNPGYMRTNCKVTCHLCQSRSCHDVDAARCQADAEAGRCEAEPHIMFNECRCAMLQSDSCRRDVSFPGQTPAAAPGSTNAMFERFLRPEFAHFHPVVHSRDPWLVSFDDFISDAEADRIIQLGSTHWGRSIAGDGVQAVRTSSTAWCEHSGCGSDPLLSGVRRRIEHLTGVPEQNAEHLQILRYETGQFYKRHHDQNAPTASAWGPRLYTFYMYLSDVEEGGETSFPLLNMSVKPKRGRAVMWPSVMDHKPTLRDDRTDHEAVQVTKGTKYGANYWLHMWEFQRPNEAGCSNQETFGNW